MPKRKMIPKSRKQKPVPKPKVNVKVKESIDDLLDIRPTEKPSAFYYRSRDGSQLVLEFRVDSVHHVFTWDKGCIVLKIIDIEDFQRNAVPTNPLYPKAKWMATLNRMLKERSTDFTKPAKDALLNLNEGHDPYAFRDLSLEDMLAVEPAKVRRGPALPKEERRRLRRARRQARNAAMTPVQLEQRKEQRRAKRLARLAKMTPAQLAEKKRKREERRKRRMLRRKEAEQAAVSKRR